MKRIDCNNWVVLHQPSRHIGEPNRSAGIGPATQSCNSHNAIKKKAEPDNNKPQTKNPRRAKRHCDMAGLVEQTMSCASSWSNWYGASKQSKNQTQNENIAIPRHVREATQL